MFACRKVETIFGKGENAYPEDFPSFPEVFLNGVNEIFPNKPRFAGKVY